MTRCVCMYANSEPREEKKNEEHCPCIVCSIEIEWTISGQFKLKARVKFN